MGTQYEKFKQKANAKAKQNRVNRVTKKANKYNDGKLNKTHKTYIAGDVKSSASTRAFGYKKYGMQHDSYITEKGRKNTNQAKIDRGENPYELKYIYDGVSRKVNGGTRADGSKYDTFTSKKRFLTDDEKKAWKATGSTNVKNYDMTHNYSLMRAYNPDGKTFRSTLNLFDDKGKMKWDGMEVAKNRVKNGGSKLNYLGGFLKDTVIDAGADLMKGADYLSSSLMGGAIGLGETINDVGKALTHKSKKLSDVNYKRAIDNFNQSISKSNKEGWGKSAVDYFKEWSRRSDDDRYNEILLTKGKDSAEKFKKDNEVVRPFADAGATVVGFGADLLNPFEIGTGVAKVTKKLLGDSIDIAKGIKNGTADISLGFTPDKGKTQEMINKFSKRYDDIPKPKKSIVEDTLTAGSREINDVDFKANKNGRLLRNSLDKGYSNAIAKENVKEVVKNNPTTPNLSNFLDSLPSKTDEKTLKDTYKGFYKTRGDGKFDKDGLFEMLDNIDDDFSYDMLDWLKTNKPNLYKEYLGDIDNVDFHADNIINKRNFETKEYDMGNKRKNYLDDGVSLHKINDVNKYVDPTNPNLNEAYNKMNMERLGNKVDDVKKVRQRVISLKPKFAQNARNFEGKVADMDVKSLNELSKRFKDMGDMENVDDILDSIDFLNKNIFGEDVIRKNLPKKHFKRLANHLEDMTNYYLGKANGEFSYNVRDAKGNVLKKYFTDKNGVQRPFDELYNLLAPTSVDEMFETKMSDLSRMFGVSHKGEITVPLKKLQNKIDLANMGKTGRNILEPKNILNTEELREYNSLLSRKKEWDRIYKEIADLDFEDYPKFMKENYGLSDGVDEILDSFAEESARKKATLNDFIDEVMEEFNPSGKALDEKELKGIKSEAMIRYQEYLGDFDNYKTRTNINNRNSTYVDRGGKQVLHESPRVEQENLNQVGEVFDLSDKKRFEKDLKEFRNKYKLPQTYNTKAKIKLSKGQKLGQLPPVIENSKNLRKAVETEMEVMFKNPKEYAKVKDYFTQVKKEYVNALRSYGVKDESYFGKVQQLQKELKQYYSELNKPSNLIKKGSESGSGTPKMGMNLQLLAEKISKTFDEIDEVLKNTDIDPLFEEGDDKVWQTLNNASRNTIENMSKRSKRYVDNATVPEKAMDYDAFVDEDNSVLGDFWKKINANQEDLSYLRPEVQEVIRNGKPIKKNNPKITSKLDDIYYRNAYKLNGGELPKPSAKLFEDGRMLDFSTGEMRPVTKNAKAENHALKEAHKYSKRNYDEDIEIAEEDVIAEGLIKKLLVINENFPQTIETDNQTWFLLERALNKQREIKSIFLNKGIDVNPLIVVQLPNNSDALCDSVEEYFSAQGINIENDTLAIWLSGRHENVENISDNDGKQIAVVIKQAVATGWDCPRAQILVKLRENMDETFEIQTIGRIRRMPEAKHYDNDVLDCCYLYTFDQKFTAGVKQALSKGALDGKDIFLKNEYKSFTLTKEQRTMITDLRDPRKALFSIASYFKDTFGLTGNKKENKTRLETAGFAFSDSINTYTQSGSVATLSDLGESDNLNTITVKETVNTHKLGRDRHHCIGVIGREIGMEYKYMQTIIGKLFGDKFDYSGKLLTLSTRELYAFIINNVDLLRRNFREAMAVQLSQGVISPDMVSTKEFILPLLLFMPSM